MGKDGTLNGGNVPFYKTKFFQGTISGLGVGIIAIIISLASLGKIECGKPGRDLIQRLPTIQGFHAEGTELAVCIVEGAGKFEIQPIELSDDLLESAKDVQSEFSIATFITYFKVIDKETGEIVTDFKKGIELSIYYTEDALVSIESRTELEPRAAYLVMEDDQWTGEWKELDGVVSYFGPGEGLIPEFRAVLVIHLKKLPDPLIGGC